MVYIMTSLICLISFVVFITIAHSEHTIGKQLRNLALNKPTKQSTTHENYVASRAVDGIRQAYWVPPYCTHTEHEHYPYWLVDLGNEHEILRVEIVNRNDYGDRLRDISVVVAKSNGIYDQTCGYYIGPATHVPVLNFRCHQGTRGRYVKVQMATSPKLPLTLCEVEVYGY